MEKNERAKYGTETVAAAKEQGGVGAGQSGDAEEIKEQRTDWSQEELPRFLFFFSFLKIILFWSIVD